ncbi:hypothetical protein [Thiobacillus thioparus]|jgi:hypothetical protein|uniref:hypothetical protein n=1 Tax=Thiobacillus thioparus TaxID=931 RepID=UPI0012FBAB4B|nr:hypothetical protein [Thiobacillus thioparus]
MFLAEGNGRIHDVCLNEHGFVSLTDAMAVIEWICQPDRCNGGDRGVVQQIQSRMANGIAVPLDASCPSRAMRRQISSIGY